MPPGTVSTNCGPTWQRTTTRAAGKQFTEFSADFSAADKQALLIGLPLLAESRIPVAQAIKRLATRPMLSKKAVEICSLTLLTGLAC